MNSRNKTESILSTKKALEKLGAVTGGNYLSSALTYFSTAHTDLVPVDVSKEQDSALR